MKNQKQGSQSTLIRNDRPAIDKGAPVGSEPLPFVVELPRCLGLGIIRSILHEVLSWEECKL
jgi:hypothetical protein